MTSSSSISGGAPRSSASTARSASSSASSASRCSPWEPKALQLAPVAQQQQLVAVRPVLGEAALEV